MIKCQLIGNKMTELKQSDMTNAEFLWLVLYSVDFITNYNILLKNSYLNKCVFHLTKIYFCWVKNRKFSILYICLMYTKTSMHKTDVNSESLFYFYYILIMVEQVIGKLLSQYFWRILLFQFIISFSIPSDNCDTF